MSAAMLQLLPEISQQQMHSTTQVMACMLPDVVIVVWREHLTGHGAACANV